MDPIRVMVVDDSPFMRRALERMLACDDIQVVGSARDGVEAWRSCPSSNPDIITLDIEMPRMDGLTCLKRIMAEHPRPVLMVSSLTQEGAQATFDALANGALDFIPKESSLASNAILQIQKDLQEKVRKLARSPKFGRLRPAPAPAPTVRSYSIQPGQAPVPRPPRRRLPRLPRSRPQAASLPGPGRSCCSSAPAPAVPRPSRTCSRPSPATCRSPAWWSSTCPGPSPSPSPSASTGSAR